ncbi:uncharacterized protein LOC117473731 [Trematomus bernacchii]|uniref:uncharacterized protein LOC117473731 n=1 Tax=Trematomus bernacchii TaxID=40690 RepID=UPI00146B411D|nr:uncharacterized protein LOC117473731 [Trematomus bernacchii]
MRGITHLLLLAAFVLLGRCQQKPNVTMSPKLKEIFSGDLFYLKCSGKSKVIWYFNDKKQPPLTSDTWKIGVAVPKHSGSYHCESDGQKSDALHIKVMDYVPIASLTIKTGHPVEQSGGAVLLQLENEDGLQGWMCWVYRGEKSIKIKLKMKNRSVSVDFQTNILKVPETIYWCNNDTHRSNQIPLRTSDKALSLEMYPLPAIVGETLTLKCLVWGTNLISHTDFYKDNDILPGSASPTHTISDVTESAKGRYRCEATFTYIAKPAGSPYKGTSDDQDVFVQVPPLMRAFLSSGMSCSCPHCPDQCSYRWYKYDGQQWAAIGSSPPKSGGTYACRAVWNSGRSSLSNVHVFSDQPPFIIILLCVVAGLGCLLVAVVLFRYFRKRTGPIYEDLPLRSADEKYEMLQRGAQREAEYDLLQTEATGGQRRTEEYEALNKDEIKGGVHHTVKMEGAVGAEGGYEALKKEGMTGGEYQTLGIEAAAGGEGGYEALKKEGMTGGGIPNAGNRGGSWRRGRV